MVKRAVLKLYAVMGAVILFSVSAGVSASPVTEQRLRAQVEASDLNKDGVVTLQEVKEFAAKQPVNPGIPNKPIEESVEKEFKKRDINQDGKVDRAEAEQMIKEVAIEIDRMMAQNEERQPGGNGRVSRFTQKAEQMMQADTDGNHQISKNEYIEYMKIEAAKNFHGLDLNQNGWLGKQELIDAMQMGYQSQVVVTAPKLPEHLEERDPKAVAKQP